jgi:hypothetical protein
MSALASPPLSIAPPAPEAESQPTADPSAPCPEPATRRRGGGPRTPEGKRQSRRNALGDGLRAETCLPDDMAAAVRARVESLRPVFRPATDHAEWLVKQVALAEVRIDRCLALELAALEALITRASLAWDDDRRAEAAALGATLARDPARVAPALRTTRQGVLWMLERWAALGSALDHSGSWDDAQRALALDLLGVPLPLRGACPDLPADADADASTLIALVAREIDDLDSALSDSLETLDAMDRDHARAGLAADTPPLRRLRRYESGFRRTLAWALAQLQGRPPAAPATPAAEPPPSWHELTPPPAARPEPPRPPARIAHLLPLAPAPLGNPEPASEPSSPPVPGNRRARRRLARLARQLDRHPHRAGPRDV